MASRTGNRIAVLAAGSVVLLLVATFAWLGPGWISGGSASPAASGSSGSGTAGSPNGSPTGGSSDGLLARAGYQPLDQQQADECDGLPPVAPGQLRLLDPSATVTAAVVCADGYADLPGRGQWQVRRVIDVPTASLPGLIAAITAADRPASSGACDASLWIAPDLVLTLADGSRIRPGLPGDGCHVLKSAMQALESASAGPVRTTVPISQQASEQEVTTGCGGEAKAPAIWLDAGGSAAGQAPSGSAAGQAPSGSAAGVLPGSGQVALCRYTPESEPLIGALAATGTVDARTVADALAGVGAEPSGGPAIPECSSPHPAQHAPATDWLMILALPAPGSDEPAPAPLLLVELGGCRRVVAGASTTVLGHLDAAAAAALVALADQPVA
jgi:hypothetical protein